MSLIVYILPTKSLNHKQQIAEIGSDTSKKSYEGKNQNTCHLVVYLAIFVHL